MPLHIDEIQTDVQMDGDAAAAAGTTPAAEAWRQLALWRSLQEQMLDERERICAQGNED